MGSLKYLKVVLEFFSYLFSHNGSEDGIWKKVDVKPKIYICEGE